ncbi:GH15848 [Drosophila grimshawi]|uniref:GH15848 n=1 Tax=Drosophila grimshawi TaxID=7222 RepID=B4J092_DROGR|nr:GH15848 [Drosophila grimshawi]
MANSRQETEKMMAGCVGVGPSGTINGGGGGSHEGSLTLSPVNGQHAATLMRHSPDIKKHPHAPHPYDK